MTEPIYQLETLQSEFNPTVGGIQIHFTSYLCTLGANVLDGGVRSFVTEQSSTLGSIALTNRANSGSITVTGSAKIVAEGSAGVGATVNKVGRTTGWTQGKVSNTCVNTGVSGTNIVQLCQTWVTAKKAIVGGGDSGSAVWSGTPASATLVGLLWGGSTNGRTFIFSPWDQVEDELGPLTTF